MIKIKKITKPIVTSTSFNFQTTAYPPYSPFSLLTGAQNSQTLNKMVSA